MRDARPNHEARPLEALLRSEGFRLRRIDGLRPAHTGVPPFFRPEVGLRALPTQSNFARKCVMVRKPRPAPESDTTTPIDLFEAIGGSATCRELAAAFYSRVDEDPVLRPLFPGKSHRCAIDAFAAFLLQFVGGPAGDTRHRWWLSLRESHHRFRIGQTGRDAWMKQMAWALGEVEIREPMRSALLELFEDASAYLVNTGPAAPAAARKNDVGSCAVWLSSIEVTWSSAISPGRTR